VPRPTTATRLLLALVLVPTGVLAWLGFQSTGAFEAVESARLRSDLELARRRLASLAPALTRDQGAGLQRRVEEAAADLRARLPMTPPTRAGAVLREVVQAHLPAADVASLRILDGAGRGVLPRDYRPPDDVTAADEPSKEGLIEELHRQADLAYYGEGGVDAALAVWQAADEHIHADALRVRIAVESARLRAREDTSGRVAADEAERLDATWGLDRLLAAGRPAFLLWLAAAPADRRYAARLRDAFTQGWADGIPLTTEERARARRFGGARPMPLLEASIGPGKPAWAAQRPAFSAPLAHGARLVVRLFPSALVRAFREALHAALPAGTVSADVAMPLAREGEAPPPGIRLADGLPRSAYVPLLLPDGLHGGVLLEHRAWKDVRAGRGRRRWGIGIGVGCLVLVTLLGLLLVRRGQERERQARRLRDEFIANVTHEVRTPLTSVLLHSQMLADDRVPPERRREHAEVVEAQGKRLAALIDDMLDFARLERGTRSLDVAPVDLAAACREALAPYRVLGEREGVEVLLEVGGQDQDKDNQKDKDVAAMADPAALARILSNLVGNAWKHGRPPRSGGGGRIRIVAREEAEAGVVEVRDDGPGIPAGEREQVFQRFGRGRRSTRIEGSGIGLALARDLARALGGDLDVSDDGQETVFRLRLRAIPHAGDDEWEA